MYKIGDFSRLCQVSVKTLHHYDEIGLVRPARVDRENGYRFYTAAQMPRVRCIMNLRALGFSLDEIAQALAGDATAAQLQELLETKQQELQQLARDTQTRLAQLDAWLKQINQEATMPRLDVVVKKIEPQLVASMRERSTSEERLGGMFKELADYIVAQDGKIVGPGTFILHAKEFPDEGLEDTETFYAIATPIPATDKFRVYELPGVPTMASIIFQGSRDDGDQAHQVFATWIEEHNYHISGGKRVAFLHCEEQSETGWVVEIQYPVEKNA